MINYDTIINLIGGTDAHRAQSKGSPGHNEYETNQSVDGNSKRSNSDATKFNQRGLTISPRQHM